MTENGVSPLYQGSGSAELAELDGTPVLYQAELTIDGRPVTDRDTAAECLGFVFDLSQVRALELVEPVWAERGGWLVPVSQEAVLNGIEGDHTDLFSGYHVRIELP